MARYYGEIGYRETYESEPGIWDERITPKPYYGDVIKRYVRDSYNEYTTTIKTPMCSDSISIVADPYAFENFHNMVYATYMGTKWIISNVDVQYPRLILALGGVYNDESANTSE
jgi:hypothetical protein